MPKEKGNKANNNRVAGWSVGEFKQTKVFYAIKLKNLRVSWPKQIHNNVKHAPAKASFNFVTPMHQKTS